MSASREAPLIISQPIPTFLGLVKKAACDTHDKTISAKEKLVKLDFISNCEDVQKKFKRSYMDKVRSIPFTALELMIFSDLTRFLHRYNPQSK
jgi:hypothetical protein